MFNHYQLIRYASYEAYLNHVDLCLDQALYGKRYMIIKTINGRYGLYALLIQDQVDQTCALVFRGSDTRGMRFLRNWVTTNIPNAIGTPTASKISESVFLEANMLFDALVNGHVYHGEQIDYNLNQVCYHISHVSGNSLGGTHAMYLGSLYPDLEAVSINPGPLVKTLRQQESTSVYLNITNYITQQDPLYKGIVMTNRLDDLIGEKIIVRQTPIKINDLIYRHRGVDVDLMIYRYLDHPQVVKSTSYYMRQPSLYNYDEKKVMMTEKHEQMKTQLVVFKSLLLSRLDDVKQKQITLKQSIESFLIQVLSKLSPSLDLSLLTQHLYNHRIDYLLQLFHGDGYYYHLLDKCIDMRLIGLETINPVHYLYYDDIKQSKANLVNGIKKLLDELIVHFSKSPLTTISQYIIEIEVKKQESVIHSLVMDTHIINHWEELMKLHLASYDMMMIVCQQAGLKKEVRHLKQLVRQGEIR